MPHNFITLSVVLKTGNHEITSLTFPDDIAATEDLVKLSAAQASGEWVVLPLDLGEGQGGSAVHLIYRWPSS